VASFLRSLIFFPLVTRREYLINRVVQFLSVWSLRHPRFFRYAVFLSSGEVVLCADPGGLCSGPSQIWGFFLYCHFIISNALAQLLSRHFRLLWPLLQGAHPLHLFLALIHCLPHRLMFSDVHYYLLEPSIIFSFSGCITRLVSHLPFGRLGVYCILHTPAVSWAGLGCQLRALLYLFSIQSVW